MPKSTTLSRRRRKIARFLLCLVFLAIAIGSYITSPRVRVVKALSITTLGTPITQNFDTLATTGTTNTWTDDTTLPGWYAQFSLQPTNPTTYRADSGGSNTGAIYSWGVAGINPITERAFGSVGSGTPGDIYWALKLTNNTGATITSLDVSYVGEQWRQGGCTPTPCTPAAQTVDFQYQVAAAGIITDANTPTTGWLDHDPLDFTSPQPGTSTAAAIEGNAAANRTALSSTITVTVNPGQEVWLRWKDINHANNDHGLAIDDFSVTPQGGVVTPTLNIGDVTQAEGDAGTSTFSFNVSLTAPAGAGGVTFAVDTADGTTNPANAGSDYVAIVGGSGSISSGNTSTTVNVTVNGDTTPEPNETFFVNISNVMNATAGDTQGLGTITNDDVTLTGICQIQGSGTVSPFATQSVTTHGIVTGIKAGSSGGFFIQDDACDADPATSNGVFVFTGSSVPAAAVVGNNVQVSGTVQEFVFASDPNSPPVTEISGGVTASILSTGNPLPASHVLTAAETTAPSGTTNPLDSLEEFEGMRVTVPSLTVVAPTQGTINEPNATVASNGVFYGVVTGVARPFREPGVNISDPLPPGSPANVPRFDENPERIRVDSDGQPGTTAIDVTAGTIISDVTGPLDYSFRTYTILPDTTLTPGAQPGSIPVPTPAADEFTVASFNMERFFDTVNDPSTSDPVLTTAAFNRRVAKASLIIRTVQNLPDVIGVEEMENLSTLQAVATQINNDVVGGGGSNPNYVAYLVEGNDVGGIDVGFLVKESRVTRVSVTQYNSAETYTNPNTGGQELLNDRPPLVLRAYIQQTTGGFISFTVIVNHLRSLSGVNDDVTPNGTGTEGSRIRAKRQAQAVSLANLIQSFQTANPAERIITVGDMNAFQFNDGYADVLGTIKGTPSPDDQTVVSGDGADLVNPDQMDLVDTLPANQRYSFTFDGNGQVLDHILLNPSAQALLTRFAYARDDADFAVKNYESTNELRISDHDQPVAYFSLSAPTAANGLVTGRITSPDGTPVSGAVVSLNGTQSRKTITDANGNYRFSQVETSGFYTVSPSRANYTFTPASRSFSQIGSRTEAAFTASTIGDSVNPLDSAEYFVRQQYVDMLGREPDEGGFNYWSDQINRCGADSDCISARRRDVAAAFFIEQEMQQTGSFVYGLYKGVLGRVPVYLEYAADRQQVVGGPNLEAKKQAFAASFVRRNEFVQRYESNVTAESFVDAMLINLRHSSGVDLASQRETLISDYNSGSSMDQSRSLVVRAVTESTMFKQAEYNAAFVLAEYFSYLHRNPDAGGYSFWLNVLNTGAPGNFRGMVCGFINSAEYQRRFSSVVSRGDGECSR